jgi:hypothetical protein
MNEPRPDLIWSEGLVRLPMRWGTEPEGWYVDHPYAVFSTGVNYSPLEWSPCISELVVASIYYRFADPLHFSDRDKRPAPRNRRAPLRSFRPLIKEKRALGISDFVTSTRLYGFADNLDRCGLFYSLPASIRTAAINAGSLPLFIQA